MWRRELRLLTSWPKKKLLLDYPGRPSVIMWPLKVKGEGRCRQRKSEKQRQLALEMEEGATHQGLQQPLEAGKDKETATSTHPQGLQKGTQPCPRLDSSEVRSVPTPTPHSCKTMRVTKLVVICYSTNMQ